MADIADVNTALVNAITAAVYPNGTGSPSAIVMPDNSHPNVRVFPGWPIPSNLEADMLQKVLNVSVYCQPGMERNITCYPRDWVDQFVTTPTLTATVNGSTVTIGGTVTATHYVSIVTDNQGFSYAATATDTLSTIAAALAAQMPASLGASASGAVITIPTRSDIVARVAAPGTVMQELERVKQRFMITIWGWNNDARVAAARVLRPVLGAITFLNFPDATVGWLKYECSSDIDRSDNISISCRDLYYWVEYPIIQTAPGYPITVARNQLAPANAQAPILQQDT